MIGGIGGEDLILRSDQEGAIENVKRKVAEYRAGKTMPEESPVGESSANGRAEEAGKRARDQARVLKDQIENKCGGKMNIDGDVMQWLVRWAAMIQTRFKVGGDGKTAWERMKGKKCDREVVPFGETIWYKKLKESGKYLL